jgi:transposase
VLRIHHLEIELAGPTSSASCQENWIRAVGKTGRAGRFKGKCRAELGWELWIGNAAQITAMRVRKQKTDRHDAQFLLKLMMEGRFPRVWMPSPENRDLRQLLWNRHRMVQMRTRILNQLQSVAMNEGMQRRGGLRREQSRKRLEQLPLAPSATQRRQDLLALLDQLDEKVENAHRSSTG